MPRTPLFRVLRDAIRLAQAARTTHLPLSEAFAIRNERRTLSRRQFVAGAGAGAGLLALQACTPRSRMTPPPRPSQPSADEPVLIVGAGIAGLTAAYRLRQYGVPVRIAEAQNRVGGRMFSLRNAFPNNQVCELGGELIDTGHTHILSLAAELGIVLDDLHQDDPALDTEVWYFDGARRSEEEILHAIAPIVDRLITDRQTWTDEFDPTYRDTFGAEAFDRMSIAEWLDGTGVSGWIRELLDVGYTTEYGLPIARQSALNFLTMIDASSDAFVIYGESDERFRVHLGNDLIPWTLASQMENAIEPNTVLEAISQRADGRFVCTFRRDASTITETATHVLLAIPFTTLRDVKLDVPLADVKRHAIDTLGYGQNAKLMLGFQERVWRTQHNSNGSLLTSLPFQLTWETSRAQNGDTGILTNFTGGAQAVAVGDGTPEEQALRVANALDGVFPGARAAHTEMPAIRFHWPTFPWTRGSYAGYLPGQWTTIRGAEGESAGNLYFAGEHCSLAAQGFMEGGCETGERAAAALLASLGISRPLGASRREPRRLAPLAMEHRGAYANSVAVR